MELTMEALRRDYPEYRNTVWDYVILWDSYCGDSVANSGTVMTSDGETLYATLANENGSARTYILKHANLHSDAIVGWFVEP